MSAAFPAPVERWLAAVASTSPRSYRTAVIEGRARFRREGKGRWLPIEAVMWHELGRRQVAELRVGLGPLTLVRGVDGFVDGVGFSRIGHALDAGPEIDQSAALFMWAEAILFPDAWRGRADVTWTMADEETVEVGLPLGDRQVVARVSFDPVGGLPSRFSAERFKGVGGRAVEWTVDYADWRPTSDGVLLPGLATVTWSDEPGPWFRMWIERANPDADVSAAMARGRAVVDAIAADPTRARR